MTPEKEKAIQLYERFYYATPSVLSEKNKDLTAKKCALIAVDEIIEAIDWHEFETPNKEIECFNKVKKEIEKL